METQGVDGMVTASSAWKWLAVSIAIIAVIGLPLIIQDPFILHIFIMTWMYGLLGQAWNVLGGYAGQISLGQTVYFGMGAYTSTYLAIHLGLSPWLGMVAGAIVSTGLALAVGYPCFRLRGKYFVIASIALLFIVQIAVTNLGPLGGACGLTVPIKASSLLNLQFHATKAPYYYIFFLFFAVSNAIVYFIERTKVGYYFRAMGQDQEAAESLGINSTRFKLLAAAISASLCSIAGTLYAQYVLFIDPTSALSYPMAIKMCLLVILGGAGTLWGPVIGSAILTPVSEVSRAIWGGGGRGVDLILYGLLIVVLTVWEPEGVMGILRKLRGAVLARQRIRVRGG